MSCLRVIAFIQRAKMLSFIALVAMIALPCAQASDSIERRVSGKWRFVAALDGAEIVSLDEREAQQLLDQIFTIGKIKSNLERWTVEKRNSNRRKSSRGFTCATHSTQAQRNLACLTRSRSLT